MNSPEDQAKSPPPPPPKKFWGFLYGVAIGFICEFGGYLLLRGNQQQFGYVVFMLVPFIAGFFIAVFTSPGYRALASFLGSLLLTLSFLVVVGLEGYICCLMAFPLLLVAVAMGAMVGMIFRDRFFKDDDQQPPFLKMLLLFCAALLLLGAKRIERPYIENPRCETFNQTITVSGPPEKVWNLIKSMDRLQGPKPFLLWFGLPLPQSCEVDHETVGGRRVCHFNSGIIAQEITQWDSPKAMKFNITESTLPGRHWLKFINAGYDFYPDGTNTIVVRHTTISSHLYPRWYWQPFESWGVQSEHQFVLADLQRRAATNLK